MPVGDIATWVGSIATIAAVAFAGWQLLMFRRDQAAQAAAELKGVAVSWYPKIKPHKPETDGWATWVFDVSAHNPGRLPISDVEVDLEFPREFRRVRYDRSVDDPASLLNVGMAVLVGGESKVWERTLRMPFDGPSLRGVRATIQFTGIDGIRHTNTWSATAEE